MTKQAYKDVDGTIKYIEISDRKKCLTQKELELLLSETSLGNHTFKTGTLDKVENGRIVKYFFIRFNHYARLPIDISYIHSTFGRGVEVILDRSHSPSCELHIRAYKN